METAYALDHRREMRRRGEDWFKETPPEFASYTTGEKRKWFETYEKLREKEEEVRQLKRELDDVEADAAKKQRTMMDAETLAEKPAPEGKRKATEPLPKESKKARSEQVDLDESDEEDGTQSPGPAVAGGPSPREKRVLDAVKEQGSQRKAAKYLNISKSAVARIATKWPDNK